MIANPSGQTKLTEQVNSELGVDLSLREVGIAMTALRTRPVRA
jgi:hypothetical protein